MINQLISTLLQVLLVVMICAIAYLFRANKEVSFSKYLGLSMPTQKSILLAVATSLLFLAAGIGMSLLSPEIKAMITGEHTVVGEVKAMGLSARSIATLLLIAGVKTSFTEELFFRGLIAKRLINKWGFGVGNLAQSLIFGVVHLVLFYFITKNVFAVIFIFAFSALAGYAIGIIKERYANGSIVPGWIAHGLGNSISYYFLAFVI